MNGAAYVLMVIGILLAKGLGFFRELIFASTFGATELTDIYLTIFTVVNLVFTGIGTAMQTLVIKNMNKSENAGRQKEFVARFIRRITLILLAAAALMYVFAGPITKLLVPGVSAENFPLAIKITRVCLPDLIFVVVAYIISGVLQNNKVFFITSIMSLPFNVLLIAALFMPNIDIFTLSIVTTVGWFLHIAVQLPNFYKLGYRLFFVRSGEIFNMGGNREALYIFVSNMMFQFCFLLDKIAVSGNEGASTTISYASNLFVTIASVFVVAMSSVVFPSISRNYEEGNLDYVRSLIQYIILTMFAIFVPFVLTVSCFGQNLICLLYERGEFTPDLTARTALMFTVYTLGILGYMAQELFNKVLYLGSKYSRTFGGTVVVVLVKALLTRAAQAGFLNETAVAATTTGLFTLYAVNVAVGMEKVIGRFLTREQLAKIGKVLLSGGLALAAFFVVKAVFPQLVLPNPSLFGNELLNKTAFLIPLLICGAVYAGAMFVLGAAKDVLARPAANSNNGGSENEE